jgi:hypothetical protein
VSCGTRRLPGHCRGHEWGVIAPMQRGWLSGGEGDPTSEFFSHRILMPPQIVPGDSKFALWTKSRLWFESVRGDSRASHGYPLSLLISNHPDGVDGWDGCGRVVFALPISHRLPSFVLPQLRRATR